ncbi:hypothetical protein G6F51_014731 [Rhizopus arrhizus]|uniref:Uncharacterized protein n=1 Tax=Rhizopus oryzae TaxID=64495 RepID=A0A9P7BYR1_RHIOR|nr:hypothetical protein G6F51_014731 [Rhizopus arrhizus]
MPTPCATAASLTNSTPTPNDPDLQRARRTARADRPVEARRPARGIGADHGQPAWRPSFAGDPGAPVRRQGGGEHLRQPDPVRPQ